MTGPAVMVDERVVIKAFRTESRPRTPMPLKGASNEAQLRAFEHLLVTWPCPTRLELARSACRAGIRAAARVPDEVRRAWNGGWTPMGHPNPVTARVREVRRKMAARITPSGYHR